MTRPLLLTILILSQAAADDVIVVTQDVKVATWSAGRPDTYNYKSLAFWIKDGKRAYIRYNHGTSADDIELRWLGPDSVTGRRGFKAGFPAPDHRILFIAPAGDSVLLVISQNHSEKFHWENENGQGDDSGSCNICAQNEGQAFAWLHQYFWK